MGEQIPLAASMFLLGLLHGLEPGHGKTIVASYLAGRRGYWSDAVYLGSVVALAHSAVIISLALLATFVGERFRGSAVEERCALASGVLVIGLGLLMLRRALGDGRKPHHCGGCGHHHEPVPGSDDGPISEGGSGGEREPADRRLRRASWRDLTALGIAGGIVPCPTSMTALLAAASAGRLAQGTSLVVVFSLGVATVLITVGLVAVKAGNLSRRWLQDPRWTRLVPMATACLVVAVGLVLVGKSLLAGTAH